MDSTSEFSGKIRAASSAADLNDNTIALYKFDPEDTICYSETYSDNQNVYRHVILPKNLKLREFRRSKFGNRLLSEKEWRTLGLIMSPGWQHYANYSPEPEVMLFKRKHKHPNE